MRLGGAGIGDRRPGDGRGHGGKGRRLRGALLRGARGAGQQGAEEQGAPAGAGAAAGHAPAAAPSGRTQAAADRQWSAAAGGSRGGHPCRLGLAAAARRARHAAHGRGLGPRAAAPRQASRLQVGQQREGLDNKSDAGKALQGIASLQQAAVGYRTLGEALATAPAFALRKRNTVGDYSHTALRADVERETTQLFAASGGPAIRRWNGPGEPVSRNCFSTAAVAVEPGDGRPMPVRAERAPGGQHTPSFERFRFLQTLNHLRPARAWHRAATIVARRAGAGAGAVRDRPEADLQGTAQEARLRRWRSASTGFLTLRTRKPGRSGVHCSVRLAEAMGPARFKAPARRAALLDAAMAAIMFQSADEQVEAELRKAGLGDADVRSCSNGSTCSRRARVPAMSARWPAGGCCRTWSPDTSQRGLRLAGYDHTHWVPSPRQRAQPGRAQGDRQC